MLKKAIDIEVGDKIDGSPVYSKRTNKSKTIVFIELNDGRYFARLPKHKFEVEEVEDE